MGNKERKAVFLDRDGVLDKDYGYLYEIEKLEWVDGAKEAIAYLTKKGYMIFVVTNQSGIARGFYNHEDVHKLHDYMASELEKAGGKIEKFYYCPHHPKGIVKEYAIVCDCRKPKPGMLLKAMKEYPINREESFLIGDKESDVKAAEAAGIKGYLFTSGNLLDFVQRIVE